MTRGISRRMAVVGAVVAVVVLAAVATAGRKSDDPGFAGSGQGTATPTATVRPTSRPTTPVARVTEVPGTPAPTPAPTVEVGPKTFPVGYKVTLTTSADEPWAYVTVDKVSQHKSYGSGYSIDKPKKGNIFIQARVTYEAISDGVDYNPFDWQVFVDGTAVENSTFVFSGPDPDLSSGTLPASRKASGWVVYEVPTKGEVRMSYGNTFSDAPPVFEIVIRES